MENEGSVRKKPIWRWVFIVIPVAIIAYILIYYFIISAGNKSNIISSNNIYLTKTNPSKGSFLTDLRGRSLYIFDNDVKGVSTCYSACAAAWPFYTASSPATLPKNITFSKRTDKSLQYSYKGRPLYYFILDIRSGDVLGDGLEGIWHLAKP